MGGGGGEGEGGRKEKAEREEERWTDPGRKEVKLTKQKKWTNGSLFWPTGMYMLLPISCFSTQQHTVNASTLSHSPSCIDCHPRSTFSNLCLILSTSSSSPNKCRWLPPLRASNSPLFSSTSSHSSYTHTKQRQNHFEILSS